MVTVVVAVAAMTSADRQGAAEPIAPRHREVIDAHVDVFQDRVFDALWRWFDRGLWNVKYRLYARDVVRFLVEHGVSRMIGLHYAHKPGMARPLNNIPYDWDRELRALEGMELDEATLDAVLAGNARRLFAIAD